MAKIIKITGYLVLPYDNSFYSDSLPGGPLHENTIADMLSAKCDAIAKNFKIEDRDIGEWDDDNVLNKSDCPVSECEKYFAEDEFVIFGEKSDKLEPENKRKLIEAARRMFKEDFGE